MNNIEQHIIDNLLESFVTDVGDELRNKDREKKYYIENKGRIKKYYQKNKQKRNTYAI
jgi:uncharacterized protein YheU (UPF0270 family)